MVVQLKHASEIRDRTHNLDLNNPEHIKIYDASAYEFITHNESDGGKPYTEVYIDTAGNHTIGHGFNMDNGGAKDTWKKVFPNNKSSFNNVRSGKVKIILEQADDLYRQVRKDNLVILKNIYGSSWDKLKINERIMIEDLYYNGGNTLVGKGTRFYKNMVAYTNTSNKKYYEETLIEVKERSNRENSNGLQNRRNAQTELGSSHKSPVYSKPCDKPLPENPTTIHAKLKETIIPRKSGNTIDNSTRSDRYYIWRTRFDNKVRPSHVENDGKIFDVNNPPAIGNPGDDYNCRCTADFYIPKWVEIDTLSNKPIIRKYIIDFSIFPNFVIK